MTGGSWSSVQDDLDRCGHVIGNPVCVASCQVALNSAPYANRTYTGVMGAFGADLLVANQKRTGKIGLMILRCCYEHSRRGLAAGGMLSGRIRAVVSSINQTIAKLTQYLRFDGAIFIEREESTPDPALVCDDDQFESLQFQTA